MNTEHLNMYIYIKNPLFQRKKNSGLSLDERAIIVLIHVSLRHGAC
jgi:hypothetical protein